MDSMRYTYGVTNDREYYAVAAGPNRRYGVWDAVERDGELYSQIEFDDIPECDWDRITDLENRVHFNS